MKLSNKLELAMVIYGTDEKNEPINEFNTYEEALMQVGKERIRIGYMIIESDTGLIPDGVEEIYWNIEAALELFQ